MHALLRVIQRILLCSVLLMSAVASVAGVPGGLGRNKVKMWDRFPVNVPSRGVPDGPLAANGDLGVVVGR
jgi:hypothetical protein